MIKDHAFQKLWIGQLTANLGDTIYIVGLISFVYGISNTATSLALVPFLTTMSRFISSLISPVIIDRFSMKRLLVISQLFKTVCLCGLCGWIVANPDLSLAVIYFFVCVISFSDGIQLPAGSALLPQIVPPERLVKANSFLGILDQTIQIVGWPVGSILLVILSSKMLLVISIALYVISLVSNSMIQVANTTEQESADENGTEWSSLIEGWRKIVLTPGLRNLTIIGVLSGIANGVWVSAILFVYVEQNLGATEEWWGYINGSFSAGMIIGGLLSYRFSERIGARLPGTIFLGTFLCGVLTLAFGFVQAPLLALIIALILGIPEQLKDVAETLVFQRSASDKLLAKIYAAHGVLFYIVYGVSVLLLGWITDTFGLTYTFLFASACLGAATVLAFVNRKKIKDLSNG